MLDYGVSNNNGNLRSQRIVLPNNFTAIQSYEYDSLNRLKSAFETIGGIESFRQSYIYDRFGNRRFDLNNTTIPNTSNGELPQVINPDIDSSNNRLKASQGYIYDAAGNLIQDAQNRTFTYDAENKQIKVQASDSTQIASYSYDAQGRRIKKITPTLSELFVYDISGKLIAEYSNTPPPTPKTQYLSYDHLGSPRIITDSLGNTLSLRDFLPFGEDLTIGRTEAQGYTQTNINQKFTGKERDNETDLDYFHARYLNTTHGRFTSADPLLSSGTLSDPQTWNRYSYVINNPLKFIDPYGLYVFTRELGGDRTDKELREQATTPEERERVEEMIRQRNQIRNGLAEARLAASNPSLSRKERAAALRALNAYGDDLVNNGVIVGIGNTQLGGAAEAGPDGNGNILVIIDPVVQGDEIAFGLTHEGSHVADIQQYNLNRGNSAFDLSTYETEKRAFEAEAAVIKGFTNARGYGYQSYPPGEPEELQYFKRNLNRVDRKALGRYLNDRYGVTPENPGPTFSDDNY